MQFATALIALMATPLALAAPVQVQRRSVGNVNIHNTCSFDITVNELAANVDEGFDTVKAGDVWSKPQRNYGGNGQGTSLKINTVGGDAQKISQVEYTVSDSMNTVFYDLSLIDGNPFTSFHQVLSNSAKKSTMVSCAANIVSCIAAYMVPDSNQTKDAPIGADLDYYPCGPSSSD